MSKKNKNLGDGFWDQILEHVGVEKEVVLGDPIIAMFGKHTVTIENFNGIIEYSETSIKLQTKEGKLQVCGQGLYAKSMTNELMKIRGNIQSVSFVG